MGDNIFDPYLNRLRFVYSQYVRKIKGSTYLGKPAISSEIISIQLLSLDKRGIDIINEK